MNHFRENLKTARILNELTQEDLANLLNVSKRSILNWESSEVQPPFEIVARMSKIFHVSIDDLAFSDLNKGGFEFKKGKLDEIIGLDTHNIMVKYDDNRNYLHLSRLGNFENCVIPGIEGKARTFQIGGDSMSPLLHFGDWVSCKPVDMVKQIVGGNIYAVVTDRSEIIISYCQSFKDGLKLWPHNLHMMPDYEMIPYNKVVEVWEAHVKITRHFLMSYLIAETKQGMVNDKGEKYVRKK